MGRVSPAKGLRTASAASADPTTSAATPAATAIGVVPTAAPAAPAPAVAAEPPAPAAEPAATVSPRASPTFAAMSALNGTTASALKTDSGETIFV